MANINLAYTAATALTVTGLSTLANNTSVNSATINNTTVNYLDYLVKVTVTTGVTSATGVVEIYARGSIENTDFEDASNDKWLGTIAMSGTTAATYIEINSIANAFGGTMPPYFQVRIRNASGAAFTAGSATWVGVYMTSV